MKFLSITFRDCTLNVIAVERKEEIKVSPGGARRENPPLAQPDIVSLISSAAIFTLSADYLMAMKTHH